MSRFQQLCRAAVLRLWPASKSLCRHSEPQQVIRLVSHLCTVVLVSLLLGVACDKPEVSAERIILIDNLHSKKRTQDIPMPWGAHDYTSLHGTKTLFDFLVESGYPYRFLTTHHALQLSPQVLAGVRILYVNLIAENSIAFAPAEIEAVRLWVEKGGSLLVIVDHTNVYDHARLTNPLLEPFGVQVPFCTAVDAVPQHAMQRGMWVKVRSFRQHPVTRGVESILMLAGVPLASKDGVAFLSPVGFADVWWPENPEPGSMGNLHYDEGEPRGPLPVVVAGDYGHGRFVVLGDENMLGNSRIFQADNFELIANTFEWLAHEEGAATPLRQRLSAPLQVGFDLLYSDWNVAGNGCNCYVNFYIDFNRIPGCVARALPSLKGNWDVWVLTDPILELPQQALDYLHGHLRAGGTLLVLTDVARARPGTPGLLQALLPDLVFSGQRDFTVRDLPAGPQLVAPIPSDEEFPLQSNYLDVSRLRMAAHEYPENARCGIDVESSRPYLLALTASGGEPFLQAQVGTRTVDLARLYEVDGGRLVVFFQDSFFRNETMGHDMYEPGPRTADSHAVVRALVQWLRETTPAGRASRTNP